MKMKTLAIAALLSVVAPSMAMAQTNTTTTPQPAASTSTSVNAGNGDFSMFLDEFGKADFTSATADITAAPSFKVVKLSTLKEADATKLQDAIRPHEKDVADLRNKVWANAKAKTALEAEQMTANDIVWIDSGASGEVTIYVNDLKSM